MNIKEFAFKQPLQDPKDTVETVNLVCDICGEKETRPVFIALTGHIHDQKCTYICKVCRGPMREIDANN